jgi:hypothetical protein
MNIHCPLCQSIVDEFDLFWPFETEIVNEFLEIEKVWVRICSQHESEGKQNLSSFIGKKYQGITLKENI